MRQQSWLAYPTGFFNDRGVQINGEYYKTKGLEKHLLPAARTLYGQEYFCFQQDGAPSYHTANSGAAKICQILFPELSGFPARQI
jgi:hypothetical protein